MSKSVQKCPKVSQKGQKYAYVIYEWPPRLEVVRLLQEDGDFLVRETVRNEEKQIVLSVMWSSPKHFIVQTSPEGLYRFEGPGFNTVQELIMHQFHSGMLN